MYYLSSGGNILFSKTYPPMYTDPSGFWAIEVKDNPFSIWELDYWEFIFYGGWNRLSLIVETCAGKSYCQSGLIYSTGMMVSTKLHHHFRHELIVKNSLTSAYLVGASVTYYDGFSVLSSKTTDINGRVEWTDAHPSPLCDTSDSKRGL